MQIYEPIHLIALIVWALFICFLVYASKIRKQRMNTFADNVVMEKISQNTSLQKRKNKTVLLLIAIILIIIAIARPQWGKEKKTIERKGVDVVFALDTSNSMLVEDMKPNRITRAKLSIHSLLRQLKSDRIALVAFAENSYVQCPLTLDYAAFRLFLDAVTVGFIQSKGTSLKAAIEGSMSAFREGEQKYNVIIVVSDGEDHEGNIDELAKRVETAGIRVYALGIGTTTGGPVPNIDKNGMQQGFKLDRSGNTVISQLQENNLKILCEKTGGIYARLSDSNEGVSKILESIQNLDKKSLQENSKVEKEDQFQIILSIALFFLTIEILVNDKKKE